jgi:hypothetical protein
LTVYTFWYILPNMKTLILLLLITSCASKKSDPAWERIVFTDVETKKFYKEMNQYADQDLKTLLKEVQ